MRRAWLGARYQDESLLAMMGAWYIHLHLDPDVAGDALSPGEVCSNATDLLQAAHWDPLKDAFACRTLALRVPAGFITNTECREPDPRTDSMLVKKLPHPSSEG